MTVSLVLFYFEFSEWEELTSEQAEYLIQVRGPHDMFQYIVRDLVTVTNVSNAAILFDDTFVMNHHFKNLLLNMPVRHIFNKLMPDNGSLAEQIKRMTSMEIKNFFILARQEIKSVMCDIVYSYLIALRTLT